MNYECYGFESGRFDVPFNDYPVTARGNRALPFSAMLIDSGGLQVTDDDLTAPPVLQVWFEYGDPDAQDVSDDALPAGHSTEGNQFVFDGGKWRYNLKLRDLSANGLYTVLLDSGNNSEYTINPVCTTQFAR
jgi:hypothetical protein